MSDLLRSAARPLATHNIGARSLHASVGGADDSSVDNIVVEQQNGLELRRAHLPAAHLDDVLLAVGDVAFARDGAATDVAGADPAVGGEGGGRGGRVVEVAEHGEGGLDVELALLTRCGDLEAVVVDDPGGMSVDDRTGDEAGDLLDLETFEGSADASSVILLGVLEAAHPAGLGHAVDLVDASIGMQNSVHLLLDTIANMGASTEYLAQGTHGLAGEVGCLGQ